MPAQDQLEIIRANGEVEFYPLPDKSLTNIGRHIDNDVVLDSAGINSFHAILDHRQKPYCFILLDQAESLTIKNQSLACCRRIYNGDKIELDGHVLVLLEDETGSLETQPSAAPEPALSSTRWPAGGASAGFSPILDRPDGETTAGAGEFAVGELSPRRLKTSWFKQTAEAVISVTNRSQTEIRLYLEGDSDTGGCNLEFRLPGERVSLVRQIELNLPAGATAPILVRVSPRAHRLIALSKETCYFTLSTGLRQRPAAARTVLGQVSNAPLVGPGLTALAGLCLVILAVLSLQPLWHGPADSGQVETGIQARPVDESTTLLTSMLAKLRQAKAANSPKNIPAQPQQRSMTYEEMFQEIGPQYGLDWRLLAAQAYQESRLNPLALGKDNDMGLMQILPSTWYEWAPKMGVSDPYDPYSNVLVAAAYLAYLRQYCQARGYLGDQWMLAAYNWGPDNIRQVFENNGDWAQVPETTRRYTSRILQAVQP